MCMTKDGLIKNISIKIIQLPKMRAAKVISTIVAGDIFRGKSNIKATDIAAAIVLILSLLLQTKLLELLM